MILKKEYIAIPDYALAVMERLRSAGEEVYIVGGCVRDSILGGDPKDFDVECFGIAPADLKAALAKKG